MKLELYKFGKILISRPSGKEALLAIRPVLRGLHKDEKIELDFEGVASMGPSWADEFVTPLKKELGNKLILSHTENSSVRETLKFLEEIGGEEK